MILHIDRDAFFASVEQLDNPKLRGKCVIVGGTSNRGVVAAASYEARKYGIHSAMPIFQARQRCPDGAYVRPRMQRYKEISRNVMAQFRTFSALVEPVSIDEAFMDMSGCERLLGTPQEFGCQLKNQIKNSVQLTCSVGIAPNRFMAKIASDMDKPDGLTVIMPADMAEFIETLPIGKVPGVGKKTLKLLEKYRLKKKVRLVGVGVSNLTAIRHPVQMDLFQCGRPAKDSWEKIDCAVDIITERFGRYAIQRASLTNRPGSNDQKTRVNGVRTLEEDE